MHPTNTVSSAPRGAPRLALIIAIFIGCSSLAMAATVGNFLSATLPKTGAEPNDLPYWYLIPEGYNASNEYPLIVFLHGSGERGNDNVVQLNNNANGALQLVSAANQASSPCFMIAPQASVSEGWNANARPGYARDPGVGAHLLDRSKPDLRYGFVHR